MINIKVKSECCGCYACSNICPKQCIYMKVDNEGFWYPKIDEDLCINCNLCEKVCPVIKNIDKKDFKSTAYACKNKDEKVRLISSSGGIFSNLCEYVIENNGVVFGAGFNDKFEVEHMKATTIKECEKLRGSKYVQSKIGNTYSEARKYLNEGKLVLFTGTQCQIKGLNLYLRKEYDNLIAVDIICHGVPSPLVFDTYLINLRKEYDSCIDKVSFRNKSKGWKTFSYETKFKNGSQYIKLFKEDTFMKGFLQNLYLRPSCYTCKAKNFTNKSDISLADFWGVQNIHEEFDDDKGVSLVLVNSKKGEVILANLDNYIDKVKTDMDYAVSCNSCIVMPVKYNKKREDFFREFNNTDLNKLIEKLTKVSFTQKLVYKIKSILKMK